MKKLYWSIAAIVVIAGVAGAVWVKEYRAEMRKHPMDVFRGAGNMVAPFAKTLTAPFTGSGEEK